MPKKRPTLYFFGTTEELYAKIQGDWIYEHNVHRLKHEGKNRITWHPTTGSFLFQGSQHVSDSLYDIVQREVLSKGEFANRTKDDLESAKQKSDRIAAEMCVDLEELFAPSETS